MVPGRFLTSLVLASSLILVLPRGWCCIFAALGAKAAPAKRCCCQPEAPADPSTPSQPRPVKSCPCGERSTIAPPQPGLPSADLLPYVGTTDLAPRLHVVCSFACPLSSWLIHPPPLRVLNCVWLC